MKEYSTLQEFSVTLLSLDKYCDGVELQFQIGEKNYRIFFFKENCGLSVIVDEFLNMVTYTLFSINNYNYQLLQVRYKKGILHIRNDTQFVVRNRIKEINTEELFVEIAAKAAAGSVITVIDETTNE